MSALRKTIGLAILAATFMFGGLHLAEVLSIPEVQVSTAEAVVGRPLTPVSVAGVARRSARRTVRRRY
jgi:hypothetical protein